MRKNQYITDAALFSAIYSLLFLASMYLPLIGTIIMFSLPVPFVIYSYRYDIKKFLLFFLVTGVLTVIFGTIINLPSVLLFGLMGLSIGYSYKKQETVIEMYMKTVVMTIMGLLSLLVLSNIMFQTNFVADITNIMKESTQLVISTMESTGVEISVKQQESITTLIEMFQQLVPMMLVFVAGIFTLVTCYITQGIAGRLGIKTVKIGKLRDFVLPKSVMWMYLIILLVNFISIDPQTFLYTVILNLTMVFQILFVLQGCSFIAYFLHYKNKPRKYLVITMVLILFIPIVFPFIEFLGIIDLGFQLRKRLTLK